MWMKKQQAKKQRKGDLEILVPKKKCERRSTRQRRSAKGIWTQRRSACRTKSNSESKKSRGQCRSERTREKNKTESDLEKNDWKVTRAFTCDDSEK
jgi:hypothetical protein